jgi:hypothetical protein
LPLVPNNRLTPGVASHDDQPTVCQKGYSKTRRHTSGSLKAAVYREYGLTSRRCGHCEVDHRIPLELGGADVQKNLWPESYDTEPWNARAKDRLENYIRRQVCSAHAMTLEQGQNTFRGDWIEAYKKFFGNEPAP